MTNYIFIYLVCLPSLRSGSTWTPPARWRHRQRLRYSFFYTFSYYWKCFYLTSLYFRWQWWAHRPGQPSSTTPAQGTRREAQEEEGPPKQGTPGGWQRLRGGHWRHCHPCRPLQMEPGWYWACRVPASSLCQEGHEHHRQGAAGGPLHPPGVLQVVSAGQLCGGGNKWYICL